MSYVPMDDEDDDDDDDEPDELDDSNDDVDENDNQQDDTEEQTDSIESELQSRRNNGRIEQPDVIIIFNFSFKYITCKLFNFNIIELS